MKNRFLLTACILFAIFFLASGAWACTISISGPKTQLASETDGFGQNISALDDSPIDIETSFNVVSFSGSDCNGKIQSQSVIYRFNDSTGEWNQIGTTELKSETLNTGSFVFDWPEEFTASNQYQKYKVEGKILYDGRLLDTENAFVEMEDWKGRCRQIELTTRTIDVDEGGSNSETFRVKNNSEKEFEIDEIGITYYSGVIEFADTSYDSTTIAKRSTLNVDVEIGAGEVSSDRDLRTTFRVSGHFGDQFCSFDDIGKKDFTVKVKNLEEGEISTDCADIRINVNDFSMDEGTSTVQTFYVENYSEKRFEITGIKLSSTGIDLSDNYYDPIISSGETEELQIKAESLVNLNQDQAYTNIIQIKGQFSDGKNCSYSGIGLKSFKVTVKNIGIEQPKIQAVNYPSPYAGYETGTPSKNYFSGSDCKNFSILAIDKVSVNGSGKVPVTIKNSTGKRVSIIIESNAKTNPAQISVPEYTYITREISFEMDTKDGEIKLIPQMEGCAIAPTTISIHNDSNNIGGNTGTVSNGTFAGLAGLFASGLPLLGAAILLVIIIAVILYLVGRGYSDVSESLTFELTPEEMAQLKKWERYGGKSAAQ